MNCPTRDQIKTTVESKGYKWFENGDYNLNIVGIRNSETLNEVTNKFDDHINCVASTDELIEQARLVDIKFAGKKILANGMTRFMVIGR